MSDRPMKARKRQSRDPLEGKTVASLRTPRPIWGPPAAQGGQKGKCQREEQPLLTDLPRHRPTPNPKDELL